MSDSMPTTATPTTVLLLHAGAEGRAHAMALARVRQLEAGARVLHPATRSLRALGRTPDLECEGRPDPDRVLQLVRRLLADEQIDAVWVCSAMCPELVAQVEACALAGVPVELLSPEVVSAMLAEGEAAEQRRALAGMLLQHGREQAERRLSAEAVVLCWLRGADAVLGARALPLPPPDGQGNRHAQRARIDAAGSALAYVGGVMREAQEARRWPRARGGVDVGSVVLRLVLLEGCSCQEAAKTAGLSGPMVAWRAKDRALDCVREVLSARRERERAAEAQGGAR